MSSSPNREPTVSDQATCSEGVISSGSTAYFSFYGIAATVLAPPVIAHALKGQLKHFQTPETNLAVELCFPYRLVDDARHHIVSKPAGTTRPIYEIAEGEVLFSDDTGEIYLRHGESIRLRCQPAAGQAIFSVLAPSGTEQTWLLTHSLFTLALAEMLKHRGYFSLHAAGLEFAGKSFLFPGPRGAGKSTLALALAKGGFRILSDDLLFLHAQKGKMCVRGFSAQMNVTDQTVNFFPEFDSIGDGNGDRIVPKRAVSTDHLYFHAPVHSTEPSFLIFPQVCGTNGSKLTPMGGDEALLQLVPNVLLTDASSSQAHLDTLGALVARTRSYRLETGRDFEALPTLIKSLGSSPDS